MPTSFQIPDLVKLCCNHPQFELRANQHCHAVSNATLRWVEENTFLCSSQEEREGLSDMQITLLAALCFPTCDMPQLRAASDLLTVLFWWHDRPERVDDVAGEAAFQRFVVY